MSSFPTPPEPVIEAARQASLLSPCKSKRGVAIWSDGDLLSVGHNAPPTGFVCPTNGACGGNCGHLAVHAEMRAILACGPCACNPPQGPLEMLHVKTIDGDIVPSKEPSCSSCSRHILEYGVAGMWLFEETGWVRYDAAEFHRLSLLNDKIFK